MGRPRRAPPTGEPAKHGSADQTGAAPLGAGLVLSAVRIAPARELAAAVDAAPLLRQARRLARWVGADRPLDARGRLRPADAARACAELDMAARVGSMGELDLSWLTAIGAGFVVVTGGRARGCRAALDSTDAETVVTAWRRALDAMLGAAPPEVGEELEGLATALYVAGQPVRMDALADGFAAGARARRGGLPDGEPDPATRMSHALEVLADLGVAEVGVDDTDDHLTVGLTALGRAGMRERLVAAGFCAPVAGCGETSGAAGLLTGLSGYDAEDGEREVASWLAQRTPQRAASELLRAASTSGPGARGAAFAIIDRLGEQVIPLVRSAMANPVLRPHAAIWLREQGMQAELSPAEKAWLLVDLGAGLLEEADPRAVAGELLPELPAAGQAELVRDLWQVSHPSLIGLLTTLTEHHPDRGVARAARKAVFKARSRYLGAG